MQICPISSEYPLTVLPERRINSVSECAFLPELNVDARESGSKMESEAEYQGEILPPSCFRIDKKSKFHFKESVVCEGPILFCRDGPFPGKRSITECDCFSFPPQGSWCQSCQDRMPSGLLSACVSWLRGWDGPGSNA